MNNLERRGILSADLAAKEKQLYIEYASKLSGRQTLLTVEEFLTWKQRGIIISFSNLIAVLAGAIVIVAITVLLGIFIIPYLVEVPTSLWEVLFYAISFFLMIFTNHSWLTFLGCLAFIAL